MRNPEQHCGFASFEQKWKITCMEDGEVEDFHFEWRKVQGVPHDAPERE
jgi:hypothetical protein